MYTKVLVPLDGSSLAEQILPYARLLAEAYGIPVELLRVEDPDIRPPFWPAPPRREYLEAAAAKYFPHSQRIERIEQVGKPAEVIVDRTKTDPTCLIAMATHGLSGIRRWLLGSVASKIVQSAKNPLLLVRPTEGLLSAEHPVDEIQIKTVIVPLDGSSLAERILPHVVSLARKLNPEVNLSRVYTIPPELYVVGDGLYIDALTRQRDAIKKEVDDYLRDKSQSLRAAGADRVIAVAMQGDPGVEVVDLARRTPNCLVAMSTHGRSGVGRWVLGSVAEKVIHYSRDPVYLVRCD
jgi:nucleotide-binding universal stress UspA family protein